jgi:hypothetical protein
MQGQRDQRRDLRRERERKSESESERKLPGYPSFPGGPGGPAVRAPRVRSLVMAGGEAGRGEDAGRGGARAGGEGVHRRRKQIFRRSSCNTEGEWADRPPSHPYHA